MRLNQLKDSAFTRIGDSYEHYINPFHFLGRTAFDDPRINPRITLNEEDNRYLLSITLPGFKKKELEVNFEGDVLCLNRIRKDKKTKTFFKTDVFKRFSLTGKVDKEKVTAKYKNGILCINMPRVRKGTSRTVEVA